MGDTKQPTGAQGDYYPPPPPGPPPGHNGLAMHPNEQPLPDSHSELYDNPPPPTDQSQTQQPPHQPPPPGSDGAPKKAGWGQRFAAPFNMLANKLGSEAFLPSTMDKECEKAARILKSFCKDGIYTDATAPETVEAPTTDADGKPTTAPAKPRKNRTLLTIPSKVINRAVGLAIFTTARAGFHVSGATGSGVIIARLPDGSWSPPSGIQVHSVGAGFMIGIDIYDCVVVINTREALEAFTKTRMSLGSDLAVVAGPWGAGGSVDFAAPQGKGKGKAAATPAGETNNPEAADDMQATKDTAQGKPTTPPVTDDKTPTEPAVTTTTTTVPSVNEPTAEKAGEQQPSTAAGTTERPAAGKERKPSAFKQAIKQPTYSYVKSRGFYAGVQVDGTIVTERKDANAAFYGELVSVQQILKGEVPLVPGKENWVNTVKPLFDTIKGAEGWRAQQQGGGQWANQMGPDPSSTYGHGNAPAGYPSGYDPVFDKDGGNPPPKPPRPDGSSVGGATAGVAAMNLGGGGGGPTDAASTAEMTPGARAKAAEAAAEAEMNREREERERREMEHEMARERAAAGAGPAPTGIRDSTATAPPGYSAMAGPGEATHTGVDTTNEDQPPAYVEDGVARPGVGDTKGGH